MKNIGILMLITGLAVISACASNEASMETDESSAKAVDEQPAAAGEDLKAEEPMMQTEEPEEEVETVEVTEVEVVVSDTGELVSTCKYGDQVRIISVVFDDEATGKACEVKYEKSTGVQTLWSAILDKDYCREKAAEFVKKQEGWGWDCSELE